MSRDGLLPPIFSSIHPKFKTPWFSTIITGLVVAIPSLFMNLTEVTDLTSIGTLFAFVLVCGGVLILQNSDQKIERKFKTPYINSKYIVPALYVLGWLWFLVIDRSTLGEFFSHTDWETTKERIPLYAFLILAFVLAVYCYKKSLSLIPVLGLLTCGYLMTQLGWTNWYRFIGWLVIGLILYFFYGYNHSKLHQSSHRSS
jgi:APA family basic amino acid/polyamine antiporter